MDYREMRETLSRLGLTEYESKTLTSLLKLNEAKAPNISREAQVPKTRVYDVLDNLVDRDLIIEIQGRPKRYRSREPEKVFSKLLNEKKKEIKELEKRTRELESRLETGLGEEEFGEKVMKVKDKQDFLRILAQEIIKAKESVLAFTEIGTKNSALRKALSELKEKNVKVKMLHPLEESELGKLKNLNIQLKKAEHGIEAFIIDGKKLVMALSDFKKTQPEYHFAIWHDSPMIKPLNNHFSQLWQAEQ